MNSLGISAYSAYAATTDSVYGLASSSLIKKTDDLGYQKSPADSQEPDDINDVAIISDEAKALLAQEESDTQNDLKDEDEAKSQKNSSQINEELSIKQRQELMKLKTTDMEVKVHEQAHIAAASGINVSAPSYDYETGPDGQRYAVGGEVNISFVQSEDPEKNIENARIMKAAALAPADPSSQDRSVASDADKILAQAEQELAKQQAEELKDVVQGPQSPMDNLNKPINPETTPADFKPDATVQAT